MAAPTLSVDDLQPLELLGLLNLTAPVSRGVILQRSAELVQATYNDPETAALITAAGDRLAQMASTMGGMMLVLDEAGEMQVPLYNTTSAVQDDPSLQAKPTYPQEVVEGFLNPVRRRVLTTSIGINTADLMPSRRATAEEQRVGWGTGPNGIDPTPTVEEFQQLGQNPTIALCNYNKQLQACSVAPDAPPCPDEEPKKLISTPADYRFKFPDKFENVISVTLSSLTFPTSVYNIKGRDNECCESCECNPIEAITPDGSSIIVMACNKCCTDNSIYIGYGDAEPELFEVAPGSYTIHSLLDALKTLINATIPIEFTVDDATGMVVITSTDPETTITVFFPALIEPSFKPDCNMAERVCVDPCTPSNDCAPSYYLGKSILQKGENSIVIGTSGLGPLLGFGHYTFANIVPPAITTGTECLLNCSNGLPYQTVQLVTNPMPLYFILEDFVGNSFPVFIGSNATSVMPSNILAEFQIPMGDANKWTTTGNHMPVGFPYNQRMYFGPVTMSKMHVTVIDKDGKIIDTRGSPFQFVLALERIYNI